MNRETKIKKIIEEFFKKMGEKEILVDFEIDGEKVSFQINSAAPEILIGKNGQILSDMQYLLARIIGKQLEGRVFVDIDVNDYKKNKISYLEEMAKNIADKVASEGKEKILFPMSSFERRIVHLALQERQDVVSESRGEGEERRVAIGPRK
jgi:spoIIIJ-associated protein